MVQSKKYAIPYAQIVIVDPSGKAEVPDWREGVSVVSTDTCILCACLPDMDGETEITVGKAEDVDPGGYPVFEGKLMTPSYTVALETVEGDSILDVKTIMRETTIRIWINHKTSPDKVAIGIV